MEEKVIPICFWPADEAEMKASELFPKGSKEWEIAKNFWLSGWDFCREIVNNNTEYSI